MRREQGDLAGRGRPGRRGRWASLGTTVGTVVCTGVLLAACSSASSSAAGSHSPSGSPSASAASGSSSAAPAKSPFRIEYIGDLTGPDAEQNVPEAAGLKAWATAVNANGGANGHPVVITTCDSTSTTTGVVSCANQVPSDVGVVVEEGNAGEIKAGPPILKGKNKLVLTDVPTANPAKGSNAFQVSRPLAADMSADLAVAKKNGITNIGVITTSDATGQAVSKIFNAAAPKAGVKVEIQEMATSSVDATVQISQLKADHAQMLYVGTLGEPAIAALQAAHTLGWSGPIFVLPADVTQTYIGALGSSMPAKLYGQPPSSFQLVPVLTGADKTNFDNLEAQYQKATGKTWNTQSQAPITAFLGALAVAVMEHVGAVPSLSAAESFLTSGTISTSLGPIAFPSSSPFQDGNLPAPLGEATASPLQWGPCVSSSSLKC